ncbi:UDP-N-acetylmuramate dehydrogenase [soil metagenome]
MKVNLKIEKDVALADLTTLKIGGKARFFVRAETENEIIEAFNFAEENEFDLFVLGGGSNVLIADEGFDGLVLQIALKGIENKENIVTAQAGEDWDEFCAFCVERKLAGIECLSGIPGLVGGTPVQNVGAYGQEVSETITKVRVFDRKTREILELTNTDCKFSYRTSIFNTTERNRFIVLAVTFALKADGKPKIVYKDLREFFAGKRPNLARTREAVIKIRADKSMVINSKDINTRSAGSFFKNPIVSNEKFAEMSEKFGNPIPSFPFDETSVKIPAAWLIEQSGFRKGYQKGCAGLSTKHTLALINCGGATANDIIALKHEIQTKVKVNFDVELKPEPVFVGFDSF